MAAGSSNFFEQFYNFPPFFTLQPNPSTRSRQFEMWTKLLQSHCANANQFILTRNEPLFTNNEISRDLSEEFITELFSYLIDNDHAVPNKPGASTVIPKAKGSKLPSAQGMDSLVIWFMPKERWFEKLYDYAKKNGLQNGGIATSFEILQDESFTGMDDRVLAILLNAMMETRKCEVMLGGDGITIDGVKFF
ncbi:Vacuolar protein-sorting-associated protein 25 [Orchesella cincta]|uniref:Vacuolar protein-sorting-associated protein 25 n=1 Tax=Orchesella cincta TaxID=48709 RepID=A0A1D2MPT3_ORCCI|nr:Vacuolar protein-sorting-associated protein 25 [Orchesella cincta]